MTLLIACMFHGVMLWIEATAPLTPETYSVSLSLSPTTIKTALIAKYNKCAGILADTYTVHTNTHDTGSTGHLQCRVKYL